MITRVDSFLEREEEEEEEDEEDEDDEEGALLRSPKVVVEGVTTPPPLNLCSRRQEARKGLARRSTCICLISVICKNGKPFFKNDFCIKLQELDYKKRGEGEPIGASPWQLQ